MKEIVKGNEAKRKEMKMEMKGYGNKSNELIGNQRARTEGTVMQGNEMIRNEGKGHGRTVKKMKGNDNK